MISTRRSAVLWLCFAVAGCATSPAREPPFLGRWRDVEFDDEYVFLSDGRVDFTPAEEPDFQPIGITGHYWRVTRDGSYELVERLLALDGEGMTIRVRRLSFDGARLLLRSEYSEWLLERAD